MSLWKKLFGDGSKTTSVAPVMPQQISPMPKEAVNPALPKPVPKEPGSPPPAPLSAMCPDGKHDWMGYNKNGCTCSVCGKTRDERHNWLVDLEKCHWCGKHREVSLEEKLAFAIDNHKTDQVATLIAAGATIPPNSIHLALGYATTDEKSLSIVEMLIAAGADIDARDARNNGWTPLMEAAYNRCPQIVKILIDKGANT